jgi:hypothetical protein
MKFGIFSTNKKLKQDALIWDLWKLDLKIRVCVHVDIREGDPRGIEREKGPESRKGRKSLRAVLMLFITVLTKSQPLG